VEPVGGPIRWIAWDAVLRARCNALFQSCPAEEDSMRKFLIERDLPGAGQMSQAEFRQVAKKSVNVLRSLGSDIQWIHSYVTGDKLYCVYLAEDAELIREHARLGGFPCNSVCAVEQIIDPVSAE
jgi:hypothetical protein